jgi:hypothetical protein
VGTVANKGIRRRIALRRKGKTVKKEVMTNPITPRKQAMERSRTQISSVLDARKMDIQHLRAR